MLLMYGHDRCMRKRGKVCTVTILLPAAIKKVNSGREKTLDISTLMEIKIQIKRRELQQLEDISQMQGYDLCRINSVLELSKHNSRSKHNFCVFRC